MIKLVACLLAISAITNLVDDYIDYEQKDVTLNSPTKIFMEYAFYSTFDIAHWIFAYSYYAISQRIKCKLKEIQNLNRRLKATNIVMLLLNSIVPAIYCIYLTPNKTFADLGYEISITLIPVLRLVTCIYLTIAIMSIKQTLQQKCERIFDTVSATIHLVSFYVFCFCNVPALVSYLLLMNGRGNKKACNWCYVVDQVFGFISQVILVAICKQICNRNLASKPEEISDATTSMYSDDV